MQQQSTTPQQGGAEKRPSAQQDRMPEPPRVLTAKDLTYLKDAMSWMLLAAKKCAHYAAECRNPTIGEAIDRVGQLHQKHFETLLHICQTHAAPTDAAEPSARQPIH